MPFQDLRRSLQRRLDEADRGDRGWWLVTRVHLSPARLQQIARYLYEAGAENELELTSQHYRDIGGILEIDNANPRQTVNRHYFLAMETPLRLLEKVRPGSWDAITLTESGVDLATEDDAVAVFEQQLQDIRFCREPWYTGSRVTEYRAFDVRPYHAALEVMRANEGRMDIDEFDLFVSRIRNDREIAVAARQVAEFRELSDREKSVLRLEVEERIPGGQGRDPRKPYSNWRDMARHTFSLFALGQGAYRKENELYLTATAVTSARREGGDEGRPGRAGARRAQVRREVQNRAPTVLRIPDADAPDELLVPPAPPQDNTGSDSELFIGKMFAADGWKVVYYNQRRGYGFDLWVQKADKAFLIEVKSFSGQGGSVALTPLEYEAAQHHGDNFLLIVVEDAATSAPSVHVIQNPVSVIRFRERILSQFSAARADWHPVAVRNIPQR
jgi:hypothetical protein